MFKKGEPRPEGAGRKKGTPNRSTADIRAVAQSYGGEAVRTLVHVMRTGDVDQKVKAAALLLDRGFGRPAMTLAGDPEKPVEHRVHLIDEFTQRIAAMAGRLNDE